MVPGRACQSTDRSGHSTAATGAAATLADRPRAGSFGVLMALAGRGDGLGVLAGRRLDGRGAGDGRADGRRRSALAASGREDLAGAGAAACVGATAASADGASAGTASAADDAATAARTARSAGRPCPTRFQQFGQTARSHDGHSRNGASALVTELVAVQAALLAEAGRAQAESVHRTSTSMTRTDDIARLGSRRVPHGPGKSYGRCCPEVRGRRARTGHGGMVGLRALRRDGRRCLTVSGPGRTLAAPSRDHPRSESPVADTSPTRGGWAFRPLPPEPRSIVALIRDGDARCRAGRHGLGAPRGSRAAHRRRGRAGRRPKSTLLDRAPRPRPAGRPARSSWPARPRRSTGCRRPRSSAGRGGAPVAARGASRSVRPGLDDARRRRAVRRPAVLDLGRRRPARGPRRVGRATGWRRRSHADSLDDVFEALRRPPVGLDRRRAVAGSASCWSCGTSTTAAAAWSPPTTSARPRATCTATSSDSARRCSRPGTRPTDRFEHFGWGIDPELADARRTPRRRLRARGRPPTRLPGRSRGEAGIVDPDAVRRAIDDYRRTPTDASATTPATN